ncbi:retron St85 family effector protein (plasmid) [Thioclava litoralis]|uniref:Retron St85 family effector protein n=1 Tax=Thioclava litoralis TaxID=3076557 RepID=A0ABZ1E6B8_9RHOB|nr:retron St85 family effector protein [Thioclava sp. FTW29]
MIIQPDLLKIDAQNVNSRVFVCGPGYSSNGIAVREQARETLQSVPKVKAIYGEEIESQFSYRNKALDLQTLEVQFALDVDFTLLILESPGSIAELGTFTQIPAIRERLIVLLSSRFYRAESYIARGPLSLLSKINPNSVIYFDAENKSEMLSKVRYPLTFYKYAQYKHKADYLKKTRLSEIKRDGKTNLPEIIVGQYPAYIRSIREDYHEAASLIAILAADRPRYAELLLLSGLHPDQLSKALHRLLDKRKIEKVNSGRYRAIEGFRDEILSPFSTTALSKLRSRLC